MGGSYGGGGGGGSSGEVTYPSYLAQRQAQWLYGGTWQDDEDTLTLTPGVNVERAIEDAWDANPWETASPYAAASNVAAIKSANSTFIETVDQTNPQELVEDYLDAALAKAEADLLDDDTLQTLVDEFEQRETPAHLRSMARLSAAFADIGATNSSAFRMALASAEKEHLRRISEFNSSLANRAYEDRLKITLGITEQLVRVHFQKLEQQRFGAMMEVDAEKVEIATGTEYNDKAVQYDLKSASWRLDIWQDGCNLMASAAGGTIGSQKTEAPKGGGGWGGALQGMIGGAAGMSTMGPWGMAAGGLLGGGAGFLA